ncbi:MAG: XdhC family protein [Solirubrobacteraceae bacterium]
MIKGELADKVGQLARDRVPFVIATVVRARRPTSVRPGDSAIVLPDGTIEGFVGGVCAESTVRLYSLRALETGEPVLLRLVPGDDEADTDRSLEGAVVEHNPCLSGGSLEIFLEPQLPAARIVVVGSAPIAAALERLARAADYEVVHGEGEASEALGSAAALIVASHGNGEERVLAEALAAGVPYVALVASATRGAAVRAALEAPEELREQLHTPAGLSIGADTPAEIAISILAEVVAERHAHPDRRATAGAMVASVISAVDLVCGMTVAVTDTTMYLEVDGERVFFCCEHCRDIHAKQHANARR